MNLTEALNINRSAPQDGPPYHALLVCGFSPLHLQTFLNAHLQRALPKHKVKVSTGLYGDLAGTLERAAEACPDGVAIAMEWGDLDPRLGYRSSARWNHVTEQDILQAARAALERLRKAIVQLSKLVPIAVALPTLPLPVMFCPAKNRAGKAEVELDRYLVDFAASLGESVALVSARELCEKSAPDRWFDLKSDLLIGIPYTKEHAEHLASILAVLLAPQPLKKGIITDLDGTLWAGIVGEVGSDGVSWDLTSHAHLHGIYQQLLGLLADRGILIAAASKNEPRAVQEALARSDLLLSADRIFPLEVHWGPKSESVARILRTWNIGADNVIFVDDSPMELAEVEAAHPDIEGVLFPAGDYVAGLQLLRHLRDSCGREQISADDSLRMSSIQRNVEWNAGMVGTDAESFLERAGAVISFDFDCGEQPRVLELINKTNQFNLNGRRYSVSEWRQANSQPNGFVLSVSYKDRFGELGTIAALQGTRNGTSVILDVWVMSCRAFSRRIEHACLDAIFTEMHVAEIEFMFVETERNGPLRNFFSILTGSTPTGTFRLTKEQFVKLCPPLYHQVNHKHRIQAHG